jgi:hypothetical protein
MQKAGGDKVGSAVDSFPVETREQGGGAGSVKTLIVIEHSNSQIGFLALLWAEWKTDRVAGLSTYVKRKNREPGRAGEKLRPFCLDRGVVRDEKSLTTGGTEEHGGNPDARLGMTIRASLITTSIIIITSLIIITSKITITSNTST